MDLLKECKDKQFCLAIVDVPYDSVNIIGGYTSGKGGGTAKQKKYNQSIWHNSRPGADYFKELFRVSVNQIIWGANHFISLIPIDSPGWVVWDKLNGDNSFSDCELAWTSFDCGLRKFSFRWQGMLQGDMANKETRIHPTQKPVALYKWLLDKYAKPGDKILDTHMGSGSIAIACHDYGFDLTAAELDKDYFDAAMKRINAHISQTKLF